MACRILVPRPGFEPPPLTASARSPSHWTARDFLVRSSKSLLSFVLLIRPHMQAFLQLPNTNWNENLITALPDPTILGGSLFYIWNRIFMIPPLQEGYQSILVKWVKQCLVGSFASLELIFVLQLVFTGLQLVIFPVLSEKNGLISPFFLIISLNRYWCHYGEEEKREPCCNTSD